MADDIERPGVAPLVSPRLRERYEKHGAEQRRQQRAKNRAQRAAKFGARGEFTEDEFVSLCEAYEGRCAYCGSGEPLTVDHIVPLASGGMNSIANIAPACASCNRSKFNRSVEAFLTRKTSRQYALGMAITFVSPEEFWAKRNGV